MPLPSLSLAPSLTLAPSWPGAPNSTTGPLRNATGILVACSAKALPQSGVSTLFTVSGGRILLTSIVGLVTVAIQPQANNTKLQSVPTVGTAVDLCVTADITGRESGSMLTLTSVFTSALQVANAGGAATQLAAIVIPPGVVALSCNAGSAGQMSWVATYVPLDTGASVAAA